MSQNIKQLKIVFFGTPEFSVPALRMLADNTSVVAVVTQSDKPAGRTTEPLASPVKIEALKRGITVLQPEKLKANDSVLESMRHLAPDYLIVVAYGKIIPQEILDIAPAINIHPSLLPELRGPSPIQTAVLQGKIEIGISIMLLDAEMDHGPILAQEHVVIRPEESADDLELRLSQESATLLLETLDKYSSGELNPRTQDDARATYCKIIKKEDGRIDWNADTASIHNMVRAYTPWPSAFTTWKGKILKVLASEQLHKAVNHAATPPGTTILTEAGDLAAVTGDGLLIIKELQLEGKKRMNSDEFIRGNQELIGALLGN